MAMDDQTEADEKVLTFDVPDQGGGKRRSVTVLCHIDTPVVR